MKGEVNTFTLLKKWYVKTDACDLGEKSEILPKRPLSQTNCRRGGDVGGTLSAELASLESRLQPARIHTVSPRP